jgi:hypothetical protein
MSAWGVILDELCAQRGWLMSTSAVSAEPG